MRFYGFLLCLPLVGLPVWAESPAVDPMQVSMQIEYPADLLKVAAVTPVAQAGFSVQQQRGSVGFDALFAGELRTSIQFEAL